MIPTRHGGQPQRDLVRRMLNQWHHHVKEQEMFQNQLSKLKTLKVCP